jgi:asparagine synthase (glutamine-hydrolysing)
MFAFALWDKPMRRLVLARDHLGQKPLFYAREGNDFLFASEIKAILRAARCPPEMDFEAVHHYLSLRFIPPPRTMVKNVRKLPAGHLLVLQDGDLRITRYWQLSFQNKLDLSESEFLNGLRNRLVDHRHA